MALLLVTVQQKCLADWADIDELGQDWECKQGNVHDGNDLHSEASDWGRLTSVCKETGCRSACKKRPVPQADSSYIDINDNIGPGTPMRIVNRVIPAGQLYSADRWKSILSSVDCLPGSSEAELRLQQYLELCQRHLHWMQP